MLILAQAVAVYTRLLRFAAQKTSLLGCCCNLACLFFNLVNCGNEKKYLEKNKAGNPLCDIDIPCYTEMYFILCM